MIFTTPNFRLFKLAARYANRAEIDPGPRDFQKRKIGLPSYRFIVVFPGFALFSEKKRIAVVLSFRHLRHQSRGHLAAQRNRRQLYTLGAVLPRINDSYALWGGASKNPRQFYTLGVALPRIDDNSTLSGRCSQESTTIQHFRGS